MFLVPTFHPAHLLRRARKLEGVVLHDLKRALDLSRGQRPRWRDADFDEKPTVQDITDGLATMVGRRVAFDIETDGKPHDQGKIRCFAFYDGRRSVYVPLLIRDGTFEERVPPGKKKLKKYPIWKPYWSEADLSAVLQAVQAFFDTCEGMGRGSVGEAGEATRLEGWNLQYDRLYMKAQLNLVFADYFDGMIAHHVVASFLPHSLAFTSSIYTDICYYKAGEDGESWSAANDHDLAVYNAGRDVKTTWEACETLREELKERPEHVSISIHDHRMAHFCERWREVGIEVDPTAVVVLRAHYEASAAAALAKMRELAAEVVGLVEGLVEGEGEVDEEVEGEEVDEEVVEVAAADADGDGDTNPSADLFAPGSLPQLRAMLAALGVPLEETTATGQVSTAKEILIEARKGLLEKGVDPSDRRIAFLDYLFAWRESSKVVGTFLKPKLGLDGRLHPSFSVHVTPTGRLASSGPNFQNIPKLVRGIFVAKGGPDWDLHVLVAGDWDSGELRLAGYLSNERNFIDAFDAFDAGTGPKVHKLNCSRIFGMKLDEVDSDSPMYRAAKCFAYSALYGAGPSTVFDTVRGEMPDMTFAAFNVAYKNFMSSYPTLFAWQKELIKLGGGRKYLDSPILKRRCYFWEPAFGDDSPESARMLNFPEQSGLADVVELANFRVEERVCAPMRVGLSSRESIEQLAQIHDELLYEVPLRIADEFAARFKAVAEEPVDEAHAHWRLPVEVKVKGLDETGKSRWAALPKWQGAVEPVGGVVVELEPPPQPRRRRHG